MENREKLTTRRRKTKQKHNTILLDTTIRKQTQIPLNRLQTTGGKHELNDQK